MKLIISLVRKAINSKFKVLGLKIIQDIKTDDFINILLFCQKNGWVKTVSSAELLPDAFDETQLT